MNLKVVGVTPDKVVAQAMLSGFAEQLLTALCALWPIKSAILILGRHPIAGRALAPKLKALEGLAFDHFIGIGYLLEYGV